MPRPIEDLTERYAAYVGAFEFAFHHDDWTRIEAFFTRDVVIRIHTEPFAGGCKGIDNVADYFRGVLDNFDRRFDERAITSPPQITQTGTRVRAQWSTCYRRAGAPDLLMSGVEVATFRGQHIARLDSRFDEGVSQGMVEWLTHYSELLRPSVDDTVRSLLHGRRSRE
ncbi:MAG TPA: nuclear transport factor 2 family protein [Burkholderiales bacterium]|nr:nuclear transport factor 2 family protein [Burkholderiales bacterium]